ncbi:MAG: hypothetical protein WD034_03980 [Parvibaculum sp.]
MRYSAFVLLAALAIGSADAHAANPYEVFRLGMSEAEIVAAAEAHGGVMFNPEEREGEPPRHLDNLRVLFGGIPMEEEQAGGMFIFEKDRLRQTRFDHYFMPHMEEAELTAVECREKFERIGKNLEAVYGKPARMHKKKGGSGNEIHETDIVWNSGATTVRARMITHDMSHLYETPRCGMIEVRIFAGTESEQKEFGGRLPGLLLHSPQ